MAFANSIFQMISALPDTYDAARKSASEAERQGRLDAALKAAAQGVRTGDATGLTNAGAGLLEAGSPTAAATLLDLAQKQRQAALAAKASADFGAALDPSGGAPIRTSNPITPALPGAANRDLDVAVRTIYGEAAGEPLVGQQGVAAVLANRARLSGKDVAEVALERGQFEPWGNPAARRRMESLDPASPTYSRLAALAGPILQGQVPEQFRDATHFYSPSAQAALGRKAPSWDNGRGVDVGQHRFFSHGYGGQGPHGIPSAPASSAGGTRPQVMPAQPVGRSDIRAPMVADAGAAMPAQTAAAIDAASTPGLPPDRAAMVQERQAQGASARLEAANQGGLSARIPALTKALANPNLPDAQRQIGLLYLREAIDGAKVPEGVKEFMWARGNGMTQARSPAEYARERSGNSLGEQLGQRREAAAAVGMTPDDPGYRGYMLSGKAPGEDRPPLTASDRKAVQDADDTVIAAESVIGNLRQAKDLSRRAYEGPLAGARGYGASLFGSEGGRATTELDNLVTANALSQLKLIFGAAPTEGERKLLLEIQGSASQPDSIRQAIYDRGIAMAEKRMANSRARAEEMRGGTYYKPGGGRSETASSSTTPQPQPPSGAIPSAAAEYLRANPTLRADFEAKYGPGSAAQVLGR